MRINQNIPATTAQGSLFKVNRDLNKSLERLSTGVRINRASDDAAGLGVSEKLRTQVRGMGQAMKNTQDTIALLKVADGALEEQSSILQRMRELIIQARNDTLTDTERGYLWLEFKAGMDELNRVARATNYNGMTIFAAPASNQGIYPGYTFGDPNKARYGRMIFDTNAEHIFGAADYSSVNYFNMMIGANFTQKDASAYNSGMDTWDKDASNMMTVVFGQMDAQGLLNLNPGFTQRLDWVFDDFKWNPVSPNADFVFRTVWNATQPTPANMQTKFSVMLSVIDGGQNLPETFRSAWYSAPARGVTGLMRVNSMRSQIGALINRLEFNVNNLDNQITNTQHAESILRDADFAGESARFTRNQILTNSATAVLAQANMAPNSVLQLLG